MGGGRKGWGDEECACELCTECLDARGFIISKGVSRGMGSVGRVRMGKVLCILWIDWPTIRHMGRGG